MDQHSINAKGGEQQYSYPPHVTETRVERQEFRSSWAEEALFTIRLRAIDIQYPTVYQDYLRCIANFFANVFNFFWKK